MTDNTNKTGSTPFTQTAYFFIKTGMRKGRVYGTGKMAAGSGRWAKATSSRPPTCSRAAGGMDEYSL